MTLKELSAEYAERAKILNDRIVELRGKCASLSPEDKRKMYRRIRSLAESAVHCKEIAAKLSDYYKKGDYHANNYR